MKTLTISIPILIGLLLTTIIITVSILYNRTTPIVLNRNVVNIDYITDSYVDQSIYEKDGPIVMFGVNMTTFKNVVKGDAATALSEGRIPEFFDVVEFTFDDKVAYENAHYTSRIDRTSFSAKKTV